MRHDKSHRNGKFAPGGKPAVSAHTPVRFEGGIRAGMEHLRHRAASAGISIQRVAPGSGQLERGRVGEMDHQTRTIKLALSDDEAAWRHIALLSHEMGHAFDPWLERHYDDDVDFRDVADIEARNETVAMLASHDYCYAFGIDTTKFTHAMLTHREFSNITREVRLRADMAMARMLPDSTEVKALRKKT